MSNKSTPSPSRDLEIQFIQQEDEYKSHWSLAHLHRSLLSLPDDPLWNSLICALVLVAIVSVVVDFPNIWMDIFDTAYNIIYLGHVLVIAYGLIFGLDGGGVNFWTSSGFLLDLLSFSHYALSEQGLSVFKLICYYLRLHRPFRYLWSMNDNNRHGSVLGTTLKYCYIFFVFRLTWVLIWFYIDKLESQYTREMDQTMSDRQNNREAIGKFEKIPRFLSAVYVINKMFIPIGPSAAPTTDAERVACLLVMLSGCVAVTGAAVASLSLVIGLYMRPEETFRTRYRLIMKEMQVSNIPAGLRDKVEQFYKMYWHRQRAVSAARLLPACPPALAAAVRADVYFKATQKSRMLRDLSYQFLSEVSKKMETIHYIPGDAIIKRNQKMSSIIYITYGDIEMLTAEDDSTAILRMVRGTVLSPCACSPVTASGRAHVEVRAATFCTAHVLRFQDFWKTVLKYGKRNGQGAIALEAFYEHLEKVKRHYFSRNPDDAKYKSSILQFKHNLMHLKDSKDAAGNRQLAKTDYMIDIAGCYIMRNRADASLTDEADAICLRPTFPCILQPKSSLQVVWNCCVSCLILAVCITHPYYLVYKNRVPPEFRFYDYVVTMIFVLDLIVYLSTGANVEDGVPITFSQTSSQQARNAWFVLDVAGTLPVFEFVHDGHFAGLNKLLRLPKVFRMLKSLEDECVYHSNFLRFMSYSLLLLLACYLLAALQQGFMCFQFGYCLVTNFTHSPFWEKKPLDEETVEHRITFGLYWAISMITFTSHMETWGVENWNNVLYTMFVLEVCIVLYVFIEAVYSATIMVTTALREDYDACIENVTSFLIRNEVDPLLRRRFTEYLQLRWYTDKAYSITNNKDSIFHDLPPHVHQDIVARQRTKHLLCIPFMKLLNKADFKSISSKAKLFCTSPNELLLSSGDVVNELYVVKRGCCEILSPDTKDVVGELNGRNHFGVFECLLRLPAFYTIRAATYVEVFSISRKHLLSAIDIPQINDAIRFTKKQPKYHLLQVRREPFVSYQPPEQAPNVERFRVPRKFEHDNAFLQPFHRLGLLSFLRYIFPRFTLRPDGRHVARLERARGACALGAALLFPGYTYLVLQWPGLYFAALLLDCAAYFDILQRMLVGYYNDRGGLVYHPASTAARYLRGAFLVDLLACLPLERLESSWKESLQDKYREAPMKQFLMLNRLLQLYRVPSALLGLNGLIRRDILLVIKALPLFLALLNVLTCAVVYCSVNVYYTTGSGTAAGSSWFIVPHDDPGGSWIRLFESTFRFNLTESPWNLHLGSYFWVVYETTTTGYSSFKPSNFNIMRVLISGMIIGASITTYFSVRIISIRANVNKALASFQEHIKDILVFMKREKLDPTLQKQVLDYYEYNWDKMGGLDYRNVLKLCEQITLRTDAILHIYGPTFNKCPILNQCDVSLLRTVGRAVRSFYFTKGTRVIDVDDVISDIYIVDQGSVELKDPRDEDMFITLTKGSMFGNLQGPNTIRCPVSVTTTSQVHLLQINSRAFFTILNDFPAVCELLKTNRPSNENYITGIGTLSVHSLKERSATITNIIRDRGLLAYFNAHQYAARVYLIAVALLGAYGDVYNAGFQDNRPALVLGLYLLDFCFAWKFVLQYFLPRIVETDEDDVLKTLMKIREKYFKTEFKYDVISFVPIEVFCLLSKTNTGMLFSWLRLNRLFRIVTVYKCLKRHRERVATNLTLTTALTVAVWFSLFVHACACLWRFIGAGDASWMYDDAGKPWCNSYYVCSLYFVLTTFTQNGVGDILPKKQLEVIFVSVLQIVSTMMFMVYVGELSNIIQYQSFRSFNFYSSYLELQDFLRNNRVSRNLVSLVNRYCLLLWREARGRQLPHFLKTAPSCFKLRVMAAAYLCHLTDNQLFKGCEPAFLRQLVGFLQLYTYNEDMYVVKESEITDSMYIIHTGRVLELSEDSDASKTYHEGQCFGEIEGLVYNVPYSKSYKTVLRSQILTLHLKDWEDLLKHFPKSRDYIYKHLTSDSDDGDGGPSGEKRHENLTKKDDEPASPDAVPQPDNAAAALFEEHSTKVSDILAPGPSKVSETSQSTENLNLSEDDKKSIDSSSSSSTYAIEPKVATSHINVETLAEEILQDIVDTKLKDSAKTDTKIVESDSDDRVPSDGDYDGDSKESLPDNGNRTTYNKSTREFQSVEDYIAERQSYSGAYTQTADRNVLGQMKETASRLKRNRPHVRYRESNSTTPPVDSHELKPIINMTADERNLKSLDSDMQQNTFEETVSSKESLSDESVESTKRKSRETK